MHPLRNQRTSSQQFEVFLDIPSQAQTATDLVKEGWTIDSMVNLHDSSRGLLRINNIDLKELGYHDSTFRANQDQMKMMKVYQIKNKGGKIGSKLASKETNPSLKLAKSKHRIDNQLASSKEKVE